MKAIVRTVLLLAAVALFLTCMPPAYADDQTGPDLAADARKSPSDPPVIPHAVKPNQDGEECNLCHRTGLKDAPPTSHPERLNCTSCHVQGKVEKKAPRKGKKK